MQSLEPIYGLNSSQAISHQFSDKNRRFIESSFYITIDPHDEGVSETSLFNSTLTKLIDREDLCCQSFIFHVYLWFCTNLALL
jgi:hypothetical protein